MFDKLVNPQKVSFKNASRGSHKLPQAHEKVCNKNESRKEENNWLHTCT